MNAEPSTITKQQLLRLSGCPKKGHFNAENAFYALGYVTLLLKFRYVYYYNSYSQKKSDILKGQKCFVDSAKSETHALYA